MDPEAPKQASAAESAPSTNQLPTGSEPSDTRGTKRKWEPKSKGQHHQHGSKRRKGRDMGRQEYFRSNGGKPSRNDEAQQKNNRKGTSSSGNAKTNPFTQEEIENDTRQPKRKVAVMLGYAGSGYRGMQMVPNQKTIEGDLFDAFVKAGAISKANADDPKKSSFVRCARTDKGVHAAGNVISLKLIIEDPKVVEKINEQLPEQIRIWGIERTTASFNCYQACDSRWYEYLIPTHSFLPPHPKSYLGTKLVELAEEAGETDEYKKRQVEVENFWQKVEEDQIKPILEELEPDIRAQVEQALYHTSSEETSLDEDEEDVPEDENGDLQPKKLTGEDAEAGASIQSTVSNEQPDSEIIPVGDAKSSKVVIEGASPEQQETLRLAIRKLKDAYILAKRKFRIPQERLDRVQKALSLYQGTRNFHNYTVRKSFRDPSSKRHIISFKMNPKPVLIGDTEWLSLKVHGQSFMMHQIRKMVGMAALSVRCGANLERLMLNTFTEKLYSIPKAPSLGLLLERPVFESYNDKAASKFERDPIGFNPYEEEMDKFKHKEIYSRIFSEEEKDNVYHSFFGHVDNLRNPTFLYLTSKGLAASGEIRSATHTKSLSRKDRAGMGRRPRDQVKDQMAGAETPAEVVQKTGDVEAALQTAGAEPPAEGIQENGDVEVDLQVEDVSAQQPRATE